MIILIYFAVMNSHSLLIPQLLKCASYPLPPPRESSTVYIRPLKTDDTKDGFTGRVGTNPAAAIVAQMVMMTMSSMRTCDTLKPEFIVKVERW